MFENDARGTGAAALGGLDKLLIAQRHDGRAHHAGEARDLRDRQGDQQLVHAGAQRGHHGHGQQHCGDRHEHVYDAHDDGVDLAAEIPRRASQRTASHKGDRHHGKAHKQRDTPAVDDPGKEVAAELVGAEPILRTRRGEFVHNILLDHLFVRDVQGSGQDGEHHEQEQEKPCHG